MKAFQQVLEKARLFVELHPQEARRMSPEEFARSIGVALAELEMAVEALLHEQHHASETVLPQPRRLNTPIGPNQTGRRGRWLTRPLHIRTKTLPESWMTLVGTLPRAG